MAILSRFFAKKTPLSLEDKLAEIPSYPEEQLLGMLTDSTEDVLQLAAIERINTLSTLLKLVTTKEKAHLATAARKRIGSMLDQGSLSIGELETQVADQQALIFTAAYSTSVGEALIDKIDDDVLLIEQATKAETTHLRQLAADKIRQREHLIELSKLAKNKDKSVYKIVKTKLDAFKAKEQELSQQVAEQEALCQQLEQLTKRELDEVFLIRLRQLEAQRAEGSEHGRQETETRFKTAMLACQAKIDALEEEKRASEAKETAEKEAKKEVYNALQSMQQSIHDLLQAADLEQASENLKSVEQHQKSALEDAQDKGLNTTKEQTLAKKLSQSAQDILHTLHSSGSIQQQLEQLQNLGLDSGQKVKARLETMFRKAQVLKDEKLPDVALNAKGQLDSWYQSAKEKADATKQALKDTAELIRKNNWAISQGYIGRAKAIYRDLEDKIQHLDSVPTHLERKVDELKTSMHKLSDWHEFAVTPKKEALVKQMQSLVDSTLHPQALADKIHGLQDKWKELCKGGQQQDEHLWTQFQEASQSAYERCKTYFDEQAEQRNSNAELRQKLIDYIREYENNYNWEKANWKEVEKTLKVARDSWKSYWPVPRKQTKELQQEFDDILDRIYGMRDEEYDKNKQRKQAIVDESKNLLSMDDTAQAIELAKGLQTQWQNCGPCKRKDDREIWLAFRANCDEIFAKRHEEHEAQKELQNASRIEANNLLDQLELILNKSNAEFFEAKSGSEAIIEKFVAIDNLPRDSHKALTRRLHKLTEAIEAKVDAERETMVNDQWLNVFDVANTVRQFELKVIHGGSADSDQQQVQTSIDSIDKWPSDTKTLLQRRIDQATSLTVEDSGHSREQLRLLCIQSEIHADKNSPAEDKDLRMTYQVQQLQQGMGQGNDLHNTSKIEMFRKWLLVPATPDTHYDDLLKRFGTLWGLY